MRISISILKIAIKRMGCQERRDKKVVVASEEVAEVDTITNIKVVVCTKAVDITMTEETSEVEDSNIEEAEEEEATTTEEEVDTTSTEVVSKISSSTEIQAKTLKQ